MSEQEKTGRDRRKLRNILINPRYQVKYILWLSLSALALTLINCSIFYIFVKENYAILVELAPMTDEVKSQLYRELNQILIYLGVVSAIFVALVSMIGVFVSHRTVGPLYHFKRVFLQVRDGKRDTRVMLRPKDDFRDVADAFNQMLDVVSGSKPKQ